MPYWRAVCVAAPCPRHFAGPLGPNNSGPETRARENADGGVAAPCRTGVLPASLRLALDILQARLARTTAGRRREPEKMPMAALQPLAVLACCLCRRALPSTFCRPAWPEQQRAGDANLRKCRWRRCSSLPYWRTVCVAAPCPRHFSGPLGPECPCGRLGW